MNTADDHAKQRLQELIGPDYTLQWIVGHGGMSTVWLADDTVNDREVAVKVLRPEFSDNTEFLSRFRNEAQAWDPKNQRPELWHNYNGQINKGESIRVFPLSNWTEQDIWQYIWLENIDIVPLYLAAERPVLERDGMLMMIDDNRIDLQPGEVIKKRMVRFRTLGCWPLTGAVESNAQTLPEIIEEMLVSTTSERQGRVIDRDQAGSMELKKRQGYF